MLKTKHFFPFIRMIRALKLKEELRNISAAMKAYDNDLSKLEEEKGLDFFFMFIDKLPDAEQEVINFLVVYTGKPRSEVEDMDLEEVWATLKALINDPKMKSFFTQALK